MKQIISENPRIGLCIATHAAPAYVALGLQTLRQHEPNVRLMVHDDSSGKQDELRQLANDYGADFISTDFRKVPTIGDMSAFAEALKWGERERLDIVVKCSRRFILNKPWSARLAELMHGTQFATATGADATFGFGFRSELVAMHVPSWMASGAAAEMAEAVRQNRRVDSLPEAWYHRKAREVHQFAHPKNEAVSHFGDMNNPDVDLLVRHEHFYPRPDNYDAYAQWPLLGIARSQRLPGLLWHDSAVPSDYFALSQEYGLSYTLEDFQIVPGE